MRRRGKGKRIHLTKKDPNSLLPSPKTGMAHKIAEDDWQRFFILVENSFDFIGIASIKGQTLYVNKAGKRLVGLDDCDDIGKTTLFDYVMEEDLKEMQERIIPELLLNGRWRGEYRLKHFKTCKPIPVEVHSFIIKDPHTGQPTAINTIIRDMTERKRVEKAFIKKDQLLKSALLSAGSAVLIADANMLVAYMNPSAERLTGWKKETAMGKKISEIIMISEGKNRTFADAMFSGFPEKKVPVCLHSETVILSKDGLKRKMHASISPVRDTKEEVAGLVIICNETDNNNEERASLSKSMRTAYDKLAERPIDNYAASVLKALSFIEENLGKPLTLTQIAQSSNMSKYHFSRIFKRLEGMSPMAFVTLVRIENAEEILKHSALSISEVSFSVGFNSVSHFVEQFKKFNGVTPAAYRNSAAKFKRP